jgi:hypothetical protein
VKYTFYGDANLDGNVTLQDFNRLAANFGQSPRRWSQGDFDFNNTVNLQDFNELAGNFGQTGLGPAGAAGSSSDLDETLPSLESLQRRGQGSAGAGGGVRRDV